MYRSMGIKNLTKLIQKAAGKRAIQDYDITRFEGMTVAVDGSLALYRYGVAVRGNGKDMINDQGQLTSHIQGFFYKIIFFLEHGITPIFVFDGEALDIKNVTLGERVALKAKAKATLETIEDTGSEEYIKYFKRTFSASLEDVQEATILLDLMGIPYIMAPNEADVVCAWLTLRKSDEGKRFAKGVCSDDSDMLPLGAPYLFKGMLAAKKGQKKVTVINLNKAIGAMEITMDQFVEVCVLCGTDYCNRIRSLGPINAYKKIKQGLTIKTISQEYKKKCTKKAELDAFSENTKCMLTAKAYFLSAVDELDDRDDFVLTPKNIYLRQYKYEELMDFLCIKHNFDIFKMQTGIDRLKKCYESMNITKINTSKVHKVSVPLKDTEAYKSLLFERNIANYVHFDSEDEFSETEAELEDPVSEAEPEVKNKNSKQIDYLIKN